MPAQGQIRAYCDLLNETIHEAASGTLSASQSTSIGASVWTAAEKDRLFRQLPRVGEIDLSALSDATGKSETEIQAYLLLLRDGERGHILGEIPAAWDVSEIEPQLNQAADTLASRVFEHEIQAAKDQYGEDQPWLIDQEVAYSVEEHHELGEEIKDESQNDEEADAKVKLPTAPDAWLESEELNLLVPKNFLDLSKNLFMNSSRNRDLNWIYCPQISDEFEEPSIFRSAFEDFYNLAVHCTRRVVQASIFQAMTRLRALDASRPDWEPLAVVRDADVHAALEILDMQPRKDEYWSKAARRCRVQVYSESNKFADGRKGTRVGRELSYDEIEAEMMGIEFTQTEIEDLGSEISEGEIERFIEDTNNFTEESETDEAGDSPTREGSKSESRSRSRSRKRKRAVSPASFARAESSYLEALDQNANREETSRLRELLHLESPESSTAEAHDGGKLPSRPSPMPETEQRIVDWRSRGEYEAEWERPLGVPDDEAFAEMRRSGRASRKRRRKLMSGASIRLAEEKTSGDLEV